MAERFDASDMSREISLLTRSRLFASPFLSNEEKDALQDAVTPLKGVRAGAHLMREDDVSDSLLILVDGWAYRYTTADDGRRQLPAVLVPGDVGNLDSLMFDRLDYGVRTVTDAAVVAIPRDRALALAALHSGVARTFTWLALIENLILSKWTLTLGRLSALERIAHFFCELSVRLNAEEGNKSGFQLPLTQEEVADALGLTSVHVNRMMAELRSEGLLVKANRTLTIPDVARLRARCGFDSRYLHREVPDKATMMA